MPCPAPRHRAVCRGAAAQGRPGLAAAVHRRPRARGRRQQGAPSERPARADRPRTGRESSRSLGRPGPAWLDEPWPPGGLHAAPRARAATAATRNQTVFSRSRFSTASRPSAPGGRPPPAPLWRGRPRPGRAAGRPAARPSPRAARATAARPRARPRGRREHRPPRLRVRSGTPTKGSTSASAMTGPSGQAAGVRPATRASATARGSGPRLRVRRGRGRAAHLRRAARPAPCARRPRTRSRGAEEPAEAAQKGDHEDAQPDGPDQGGCGCRGSGRAEEHEVAVASAQRKASRPARRIPRAPQGERGAGASSRQARRSGGWAPCWPRTGVRRRRGGRWRAAGSARDVGDGGVMAAG